MGHFPNLVWEVSLFLFTEPRKEYFLACAGTRLAKGVEVGAAFSLIHETAHVMAPCVYDRISRYTDYWKAEAVAEYLMKRNN